MLRYCLLMLLLVCTGKVDAQYNTPQNKVWAFGRHAGLNFNSGLPVPFTTGISALEGCASVCNSSGGLLLYTDGVKIYNRLGSVMPSGSTISPFLASSTSQAALIIPVIGFAHRYYVFSLEMWSGTPAYSHLTWCMVDTTLDGGLGDVVASSISTTLTDSLSEKMIAIPGEDCNIWLITHKRDEPKFYAFEISAAGLNTIPVISVVGGSSNYIGGVMKASSDRSKIVTQSMGYPSTSEGSTELFDFSPASGMVSNCRILDSVNAQYGAEFSPDNTKLYTQWWDYSATPASVTITQYNITLTTAASIRASATTIYTVPHGRGTDLRLAPDAKIYLRSPDTTSGLLDCISLPNAAGSACNYIHHAINLYPDSALFGFPNLYVEASGTPEVSYTTHDTTVCLRPGDTIMVYPHETGPKYYWYDWQSTYGHAITAYGTYWVHVINHCIITTDTIKVIPQSDTAYTAKDTAVCVPPGSGSFVVLYSGAGSGHIWSNGSSTDTIHVNGDGTWWCAYTADCTYKVDTVNIRFLPPQPIGGPDSLCITDIITLTNIVPGGVWSSGAASVATVDATTGIVSAVSIGTATITYTLPSGCETTKTIIVVDPCTLNVRTQQKTQHISLYPDPASVYLTIKGAASGSTVAIFNYMGQVMQSREFVSPEVTMDILLLPAGVYLVTVDGAVAGKFVKY